MTATALSILLTTFAFVSYCFLIVLWHVSQLTLHILVIAVVAMFGSAFWSCSRFSAANNW
jgi:hypothetical protein